MRKLVLLVPLSLLIFTVALSVDGSFYSALLERGKNSFREGQYPQAVKELKIASFGLLDSVANYQTALVYLAVAQQRTGDAVGASASIRKVVAAERVTPSFRTLPLEPAVRTAFEGLAKSVLAEPELAVLLGTGEEPASVVTSQPPAVTATVTPVQPQTDPEADRRAAEQRVADQRAAERAEAARQETARREAAELEAGRREAERLETQRREAERVAAQRQERERSDAERREAERRDAERLEAQRREAERLETQRREAERLETQRREAERLETQRREAERLETQRRHEAERIAAQRRETERLETGRREAERDAARREAERLETDRREAERRVTTAQPAQRNTTPPPLSPQLSASERRQLSAANDALQRRDFFRARELYTAILNSARPSRAALLEVARGLYQAGDFRGSVAAFSRVGTLQRGEEQYHYYAAVALFETGSFAAAKKQLACALPFIQVTDDVARYQMKIQAAID